MHIPNDNSDPSILFIAFLSVRIVANFIALAYLCVILGFILRRRNLDGGLGSYS